MVVTQPTDSTNLKLDLTLTKNNRKMKKSLLSMVVFLSGLTFFSGCTTENTEEAPMGDAYVEIARGEITDESKCKIIFTPSGNTVSFCYAIGGDSDELEQFQQGAMASYTVVDGAEQTEVEFTDLEDGIYTVYAMAYDESEKPGRVNILKVYMPDGLFQVESQYVTHESAGFQIACPGKYFYYRYAFGKPEDREAFENETLESIKTTTEEPDYCYNYFDLEPDTDYSFFVEAYDRGGFSNGVIETKIHTYKEGECPAVTFKEVSKDALRGVYELVPNELCGMIGAGLMDEGQYDDVIYHGFNGNLLKMIDGWKDVAATGYVPSYKAVGETLVMEEYTVEMLLDLKREIYTTVYDKDFNVTGVQRFRFTGHTFVENAPEANITITISNITSKGATYLFEKNENVMGMIFETIDGAWYDEALETETGEYWLHERLFTGNSAGEERGYLVYGNDNSTFIETKATPNTKYYAAACPMNVNGPREGGWGPLAIEEYTTLK